ncbi:putative Inositol hexakisphosphate [Leishmania naiffi]|uniref:Inositol hexakisphosphate n=1 Tax=Leishmania naiffi TaxID=5678 RepID=A0AAW3BRE5_9TRYP
MADTAATAGDRLPPVVSPLCSNARFFSTPVAWPPLVTGSNGSLAPLHGGADQSMRETPGSAPVTLGRDLPPTESATLASGQHLRPNPITPSIDSLVNLPGLPPLAVAAQHGGGCPQPECRFHSREVSMAEEEELRDLRLLLHAQSSRLRRHSSAATLTPKEARVLSESPTFLLSSPSKRPAATVPAAVTAIDIQQKARTAADAKSAAPPREGCKRCAPADCATTAAANPRASILVPITELCMRSVRSGALYARCPNDGCLDGDDSDLIGRPPVKEGSPARSRLDDSEEALLTALERESAVREARLDRLNRDIRKNLAEPSRSSAGHIYPPPPPVMEATSDAEVHERAMAAEDFAKSLTQRRQHTEERNRRQQQRGRPHTSHSPLMCPAVTTDTNTAFSTVAFLNAQCGDSADGEGVDSGEVDAVNGHSMSHVGNSGQLRPPRASCNNQDPREASEMSMASLALGRMSMRSCSVAKVTDSALAIMEMLANRPDVLLPSPAETASVRRGDVLSSKHILKRDLEEALQSRKGSTGMIAGAPFFRIVPKLNIAGVAQANASAVRTIVNELRRAHVEGPIIWVNLREEPLVYINDNSYIVRERADPLKPIIIPNVTGLSIESVERKLKQEVLQEAYENGGNVSVHLENRGGGMEDQWVSANRSEVLTLAEVFHRLEKETNHQVMYFRRPITQNIGPQPEDFDFVLDACLEEPKAVFVFSCQSGRGRTSSMMQIANIVRFYQLCVKDVMVDLRVLREKVSAPSYRTIQKLVSLFPDGKLHERRLMILMELADKVYSMADHINEAFSGMDGAPEVAKMRLQVYALFLVFSYYCEQRLWNYSTHSSFAQWLNENPEMKLLVASVREKLGDQLQLERVASPFASGPEADALRAIRHRRGNVLSTGRILCSLPVDNHSRSEVIALRQLAPGVPVLTCGRVGEVGRDQLVCDIRGTFPHVRSIHWISLRAEPMVLINDVTYTLSDYDASQDSAEHGTTMHASVQAMEQIEDRLRRDVLLEAQDNGGFIILHRLTTAGEREVLRVKVVSVRTPRSTMEEFVEATGVCYTRIPMPFSGQLLASDIDPLFHYLAKVDISQHDAIVINDSAGTSRTTVALNILTLFRASRLGNLRSLQTTEEVATLLRAGSTDRLIGDAQVAAKADVAPEEIPEHHVELLLASTICQMLTAGSLLRTVDAVISLGGRGQRWNILHALDLLKKRIGVLGNNKPQCIVDALHGLRCYLLVLLSCLYLDAQKGEGFTIGELLFSDWVTAHAEVSNIIEHLEDRGEAALKYVAVDNLMKADLSRRSGNVLTANFCLKADHFPGCQKKGLRPALCGAPNFRKVDFVNVYGVAIPTLMGIHNVLSLLGASSEPLQAYQGQSNDSELYLGFAAPRLFEPAFKPEGLQCPLRGSVVWVNLREEPILYVGDRPFVFRDLAAPYVNVELTGIQTEKVELVEYELKRDVLMEAAQYDGKFLVHDEGNPGELVGVWELASEETVKTLREVYDELLVKEFRCQMLRLPVTDEQSPEVRDFDLLVGALLPRIAKHLDRRETLSFVFNCQMGRGRTTTGMVICCLLIGLVTPEYYDELHNAYRGFLYAGAESDLGRGEYSVIVQLKRVLTQGRTAKHQVDLVLEVCSKMQNLRTAIEAFAIAASSPDTVESDRARAHHAGVHYLKRYFNLIVFAAYLQEEYDRMLKRMRRSFTDWMSTHPEIFTLLDSCVLK